jgi:hypothetical protein
MKLFAEYVLDEQMKTTGQTLVLLKGLFNLPAQRVAFGSFEISFRSPIADAELTSISAADMNLEKSALEEVGLMLRTGLEFLENADQGALNEPKTSEKDRVILQAMKYLTPSSQGPIQEIELGGNLLGTIARRHTLTRENRRTVNQALARSQATTHDREVIQKVGYIRELDKDRLTCILRESDTDIGTSFLLDEELLEDVVDVFSDNLLVRVIGLSVPLKDTILAIALERKTQ